MVASSIWLWFIPVYVLAGLVLLLLAFSLVARIQGGRYVRPIVNAMTKVPLLKRWMQKASRAALEKQNPELASAIAKLERAGVARDPQRAQAALSRLTAGERRAYMEAAGAQGQMPTPSNRQERRRMEKLQKKTQGR
jgi:hypothetical protein